MELKEGRAAYSIERKEAAAMLGVSMRTIDRYIRSGKLSHKKVGYNVFLEKDELERLVSHKTQRVSHVDVIDNAQVHEEPVVSPQQVQHLSQDRAGNHEEAPNFDVLVYKSLYEGTKKELDQKQREVELLNYRIGKMEIELGNMVPLLDYQSDQKKAQEEVVELRGNLDSAKAELEMTRRFNTRVVREKSVYVGAVLILALLSTILASLVAL